MAELMLGFMVRDSFPVSVAGGRAKQSGQAELSASVYPLVLICIAREAQEGAYFLTFPPLGRYVT